MHHPTRIVLTKTVSMWVSRPHRWKDTFDEILDQTGTMSLVHKALDGAAPEVRSIADGVRAWIKDDDTRFGLAYSDDIQLAAFALFSRWVGRDFPPRWVAAVPDLRRALRLALAGEMFRAREERDRGIVLLRADAETAPQPLYMLPYALDRLVEIAPEFSSEERMRAVEGVVPSLLHPVAQLQLAQIGGNQAAIDALAARVADDRALIAQTKEVLNGVRRLLAATRDPETFEKLARATPHELRFGGVQSFATAMPHLPSETIARVLSHAIETLERLASPGDKKQILKLAACVDDEQIAELMAARALVKNVTTIVSDYFERFPHRIDALEKATKGNAGTKKSTRSILDLVERRVAVDAAAPVVGANGVLVDPARANDGIPKCLVQPPWLEAKAKAKATAKTKTTTKTKTTRAAEKNAKANANANTNANTNANANANTNTNGPAASTPNGRVADGIPDEPAEHLHPQRQYLDLVTRYPNATDASDGLEKPLAGYLANVIATLRWLSDPVALRRLREDADNIIWGRHSHYLEALMTRLGSESVPILVRQAAKDPSGNVDVLLNVASPRSAAALATLLQSSKVGPRVRTWMLAHADVAALGCIAACKAAPEVLDAKTRDASTAALAWLVASGRRDAIDAACTKLGVAVPDSVLVPTNDLKTPGKLPRFADSRMLPAVIVEATGAALPSSAMDNLLQLLSVVPTLEPHPTTQEVKAACTRDSLDAFVSTLVSDWSLAGARSRDDWALYAAGHLGSEAVARMLDGRCVDWINAGKVDVMQKALDVLALIGSDPKNQVSLALLYERGLRARFEDTQVRVQQLLEQVAVRQGITYEDLEDRLVPALGLDADRPITLDYGTRKFEVKLDERLMPVIIDPDAARRGGGRDRLNTAPRVTKKDDAQKAKAARARFDTLKEDLERVAVTQILRMERAMREARAWDVDVWIREVVRHPLLRHLATKLVWDVEGILVRIAEDGSFADSEDETVTLASITKARGFAAAKVKVAHPVDAVSKDAWQKMTQLFFDYELLQPFPQLAREVIAVPEDIKKGVCCMEYGGAKASWSSIMTLLTGRGWRRTAPIDGTVRVLELPLDRLGAPKAVASLTITPGLTIGPVKARPMQTLAELTVKGITFGDLSARAASELLRDVATLNA